MSESTETKSPSGATKRKPFRLKSLHTLVINSYLGPFVVTFFVCLFLLLMQFLWKYVDDLMGKGLEFTLVAELMLYASANLVPMALPLAILLSSIMTFGNLGERSELTAMKSAGLSLFRIMKPLVILIVITSVGAFGFSNYLWPKANLKFKSLLYDITEKKPTFNLTPNVFYGSIPGYAIRISDKKEDPNDPEKAAELYDVWIYDHTEKNAINNRVTWAERGVMDHDSLGNLSVMLYDGIDYWEYQAPRNQRAESDYPHIFSEFEQREVTLDLSSFSMVRRDEDIWSDNIEMLNLSQLSQSEDTLKANLEKRVDNLLGYVHRSMYLHRDTNLVQWDTIVAAHGFFDSLSIADKTRTVEVATNQVGNIKRFVEVSNDDFNGRYSVIRRHGVEWHRKFTLSFACIILFFIGAPLGALVRKGGLGMPVVFSVVLFLIFHILSITGEKMAKQEVLEPWAGMWLSSAILFPFGIWLTYMAARDAKVGKISFAWVKRIFKRKASKENEAPAA